MFGSWLILWKTSQPNNRKPGFFKRTFHHPNFGVAAGLMGILGTTLAVVGIILTLETIQKPDLTYYVCPDRTAIVKKGNLHNFLVTFWGEHVESDLSAAEIQIWNRGKAPILGGDVSNGGVIEKPIVLRTPDGEPIYKVIITSSRDAIGTNITNIPNHQSGVMPIGWKILEENDGLKLQIIYGGGVDLPLTIDGVIKGQKILTSI